MPQISVIIPVYQGAATIGRAIRSVLEQTCRPHEVLIVDDGSSDDLAAAVRPFGSAVHLIALPHGGAAKARNAGLEMARGDYVAFLDADDFWWPRKLQRQVEVLAENPGVGVVSCLWMNQWPEGPPRPAERRRFARRREHYLDRPLRGAEEDLGEVVDRVCTCAPLMRREVLEGHRFSPALRTHQDRDFWLRVFAGTVIYILSEALVTVVMEPRSLSRDAAALERNCQDLLAVAERNAELLGARAVCRDRARAYHRWARGYLRAGQGGAALKPALAHLGLEPTSARAWWTVMRAAGRALLGPDGRARGDGA